MFSDLPEGYNPYHAKASTPYCGSLSAPYDSVRQPISERFYKSIAKEILDRPGCKEKPSFTQNEDVNRPLAIVGDSVLNLVVNKKAYCKSKNPKYLDVVRKKFAEKKANQKTLNQDIEFTKFLVENKFTKSPIGGIGLEKADRFFEAIIGAVFIEHDFEVAEQFVITLMKVSEEFVAEFPDAPKS